MVRLPKKHHWTPNQMNDYELNTVLNALKHTSNEQLHGKFWCWKMNYRKKNYGIS